jgi:hypothetical protein
METFDDENTWRWFCWLARTEEGQRLAKAIEASRGSMKAAESDGTAFNIM